jgi:hypothetical protein
VTGVAPVPASPQTAGRGWCYPSRPDRPRPRSAPSFAGSESRCGAHCPEWCSLAASSAACTRSRRGDVVGSPDTDRPGKRRGRTCAVPPVLPVRLPALPESVPVASPCAWADAVVRQKRERVAETDFPSEGDTRWVRLYGVARQVKVAPVDRRVASRLGGTVSAQDLITGVWRNYSRQELKRTRAEWPEDDPVPEPIADLPAVPLQPQGGARARPALTTAWFASRTRVRDARAVHAAPNLPPMGT